MSRGGRAELVFWLTYGWGVLCGMSVMAWALR